MKANYNKICEICGDKGIGRHFGAITCESCKAFFRRNAPKDKVLDCPSDGKCRINASTRKLCQNCRLQKCYAVGMKKEFILSNEEREERRRLVEENRRKRRMNCKQLAHNDTSSDGTLSSDNECLTGTDTESVDHIIGSLLDVSDEELTAQVMDIEEYITRHNTFDKFDARLVEAQHKCKKMTIVPLYKQMVDYQGLNDLETNKISQLLSAAQIFKYPPSKTVRKMTDKFELLRLSGQRSEQSVKDFMQFTKCLNGFANACPDDQYSMFKYGVTEMMFFRALMYYNITDQSFTVYIDNDLSFIVDYSIFDDDLTKYSMMFKEMFMNIMNKFLPEWERDQVIMELISAIVLFNPNRPNLKHKTTIKLEQQLYIYLLQRYLLLKYGSDVESRERLQTLMSIMLDVYQMSEFQKSIGIEEYKQYVKYYGPLFRELYDF